MEHYPEKKPIYRKENQGEEQMNQFTYMKDREFSKGRKYLGASDAPTIAGINPYQTPMELWEIMTGRAEGFKGNERTAWGHKQEPTILGEYIQLVTGSKEKRNDFITSRLWGDEKFENFHSWTEAVFPDNPRILSHADLLDLSGKAPLLVQAKNTGAYAAAARKRDPNKGYDKEDHTANGIPLSVYFQEHIEMMTYGIPEANVAVLIDGWDWQLYGPIQYDKKTAEQLLALYERMLWHIDKDTPPTPQTWGDVLKLYPNFEKNTKAVVSDEAEIECRQMIEEHGKLSIKAKEIERRQNDIKNALGLYIGGNNYLQTPEGHQLASAAEISGRETISVSELKKHPELFEKVSEAGLIKKGDNYRNLYIKGAAAGTVDLFTLLTTNDGEKWNKSRKKYSSEEKKDASALLKSLKIDYKWEKFS